MSLRSETTYRANQSPHWRIQWAYLASWRGQLVITGIAFLIGGIVFILREPYAKFKQKRREAISKARERELISMESSDPHEDKDKRGNSTREKRKEGKKRKESVLRSSTTLAETSATETSPAPITTPLPKKRAKEPTTVNLTPARERCATLTLLQPSPENVTHDDDRPTSLSAADIPLPPSPTTGTSLLPQDDLESVDGESGNTSESASNHHLSDVPERRRSEPMNFSIIPEEGYLPAQTPISAKKKKRKGRAPPPPLPTLERRTSSSNVVNGLASPAPPATPSSRARKASLTRPVNADLDALLTERESTIESLRAEIGRAKAEESKAKDGLARATTTVERLQGDYERARKASQRADHASRRREGELNSRLTQLSTQYAAALHRIDALEAIMQESGRSFPPISPALPPQGLSPAPIQYMQTIPSPMPPSSPFGNGFGPSPRAVSAGYMPYPSPGMYPSPMLHPHYHSPSPFRRASSAGLEESLAGPLTPGQPSPMLTHGSGSYPFDLGIMPPPSAPSQPNANGPLSAADLRRMSIESSVLKKKKDQAGSGDDEPGLESLPDADETIHGLGVGDVEMEVSVMQRDDTAGGSGSISSHPSSPSPPARTSLLLTPSSSLYHQALIRGAGSTEDFARDISHVDLGEIKMVTDGENGNLYYTARNLSVSDGDGSQVSDEKEHDGHVEGPEKTQGAEESEEVVPMFASLAHTPQQLREIKEMRDKALRARVSRSSSQSGESIAS